MCGGLGQLAHAEGGVDREDDLVRGGKVVPTRQDVIGAVDADGQDGHIQLRGYDEAALLEARHAPRLGAAAFGEDEDRVARSEHALGILQRVDDGGGLRLVDEDIVRRGAGLTHEGHLAQLGLQHPLEGDADMPIEGKDVVGALMIGHDDTGRVGAR